MKEGSCLSTRSKHDTNLVLQHDTAIACRVTAQCTQKLKYYLNLRYMRRHSNYDRISGMLANNGLQSIGGSVPGKLKAIGQ
jgi:hypothetical protein